MENTKQLSVKRKKLLVEINNISSMRKGVLNATYQNVTHKNGETVKKGPYYILSKKSPGGKTVSQSIPHGEVPRIRQEVANYKKFRELSEAYVEVCESISLLADGDGGTKKN
jgi:hypothetical protein